MVTTAPELITDESNIAEVVLECVHNDTIDLTSLAERARIIAFPLGEEESGKKSCNVACRKSGNYFAVLTPF